MSTSTKPLHVLIIGNGLAGPCLALSLARHKIRSTIYEIRPTPSLSGGSISLTPNGLKVLDQYANVYSKIKASGFSYYQFGAYTAEGEKLGEIRVAEESRKGEAESYPAIRILRSVLHKVLLEKIDNLGGMIEVNYGMQLERIQEDEKGVVAYFEGGSTAKGDIIIGSDGIHSKVRQHILGADSPTPAFAGICVVNGYLPATVAVTPPDFKFPSFMFTPSGLFMTIPIDPLGETLAWGINMTTHDRTRAEWAEFQTSGEAARLAKADYDGISSQPVRSLLDNAKNEETKLWATYSIPDIPTWHKSRVCLVGDAAHGLPPNGQGSGLAFEDVAILTRLLTDSSVTSNSDFEKIFEKFENIRRPRLQLIRDASKTGEAFKGKTGALAWYLKKWAFRGFFWWNRGVLHHTKETTYDVDGANIDI